MLVNQKITVLRKEKNMTMADLASLTGIARTSISRYESGKIKRIESDKLDRIAAALDTSSEELTKDDPLYQKNSIKGPYDSQKNLVMVQDDYDKELLFTFHQLSSETKIAALHLFQTIATFTS